MMIKMIRRIIWTHFRIITKADRQGRPYLRIHAGQQLAIVGRRRLGIDLRDTHRGRGVFPRAILSRYFRVRCRNGRTGPAGVCRRHR